MAFFGDSRVMACTREDLERWVGALIGQAVVVPDSGALRLCLGWGVLEVQTEVLPPHRIALLRVPQLAVRFRYDPSLQDQARAWIAHFDRHTQRGGG